MLLALSLFPNSFKQVVAAKQTGQKRDQCTSAIEMCLFELEQSTVFHTSLTHAKTLCLQLLGKLHLAREKVRLSFHDTLMRAMTNLLMYVDVCSPRAFDAEDLSKELPIDQTAHFAFHALELNSQE
jgi:hypothetical protein